MWISKKGYSQMEAEIEFLRKRIEKLDARITELERIHQQEQSIHRSASGVLEAEFYRSHKSYTESIGYVSLEELTQFVIDKKPIVRTERVEVKREIAPECPYEGGRA